MISAWRGDDDMWNWLESHWTAIVATFALGLGVWNRVEQWSDREAKKREKDPRGRVGALSHDQDRTSVELRFENPGPHEAVIREIRLVQPAGDKVLIRQRPRGREIETFSEPLERQKVTWVLAPTSPDGSGTTSTWIGWSGPGAEAFRARSKDSIAFIVSCTAEISSPKKRTTTFTASRTIKP